MTFKCLILFYFTCNMKFLIPGNAPLNTLITQVTLNGCIAFRYFHIVSNIISNSSVLKKCSCLSICSFPGFFRVNWCHPIPLPIVHSIPMGKVEESCNWTSYCWKIWNCYHHQITSPWFHWWPYCLEWRVTVVSPVLMVVSSLFSSLRSSLINSKTCWHTGIYWMLEGS